MSRVKKFVPPHPLNTAVLFLIFNRPDTTKQVFQQIRKARPPRLYVAADGPRKNNPTDFEKCTKAREIATNVDWECEVRTLFQENNIGCGPGPVTGISWFFKNEEYGIILEDDCNPSLSFFPFCEELLDKYKCDNRIFHINGNNFGANEEKFYTSNYSYHFGTMPQAWGWASWRRAWRNFDWEISNLDEVQSNEYLSKVFSNNKHFKRQLQRWKLVERGRIDTWDFQWQFSVISNHGLTIVPKLNLISNIGFGEDATHTHSTNSDKSSISAKEISFPITHPITVIPDEKLDRWFQERMLGPTSIYKRVKNKLRSIRRHVYN